MSDETLDPGYLESLLGDIPPPYMCSLCGSPILNPIQEIECLSHFEEGSGWNTGSCEENGRESTFHPECWIATMELY